MVIIPEQDPCFPAVMNTVHHEEDNYLNHPLGTKTMKKIKNKQNKQRGTELNVSIEDTCKELRDHIKNLAAGQASKQKLFNDMSNLVNKVGDFIDMVTDLAKQDMHKMG